MNTSQNFTERQLFFRRMIIETSGVCNLRCKMCPTLYYGLKYKDLMSNELFLACLKYIHTGMEIILTGWGEPLLDPNLAERIHLCKKSGATVYIATNGVLLTHKTVHLLLEAGLDGISISLDAGTKDIYESIRKGSDFKTVTSNMRGLVQIKKESASNILTDANFVTMKSNFDDLKNFISLIEDIGLDTVTITRKFLSFSEKDNMAEYIAPGKIRIELDRAIKKVKPKRCQIRTWALDEKRPENDCLAQAVNTVFISWDGNVSACCNLGHPAPRYLTKTGQNILPYTIFGNMQEQSLEEICRKRNYILFRDKLRTGIIPHECKGCPLV